MAAVQIAHIRKEGQDVIIVPVGSEFGSMTERERNQTIYDLQDRAKKAGITGIVTLIWDDQHGVSNFIAPDVWHGFFANMSTDWARSQINATLP